MLVGALSDAFGLNIAIVYVQFVFVLGALMLLCAGFTYQGDFDRAGRLISGNIRKQRPFLFFLFGFG